MPMSTVPLLIQTAPAGGSLAVAADVAIIVVAIAVLVMAAALSIVMVRISRMLSDVRMAAERSFGPVSDKAKIISNNLEFVTQAIRTDVEHLNGSVRALTDRLHSASEHMEQRIDEFNALMEVVQGEAEELFLDTASTVRGVREGARAITAPSEPGRARRGGHPGPGPSRPEAEQATHLAGRSDADGAGAAEQ